mmetsp:Transcript_5562/g.18787  ORF Transcript_5562/g.18787 Transcript_5562/m.18787 type:complete len:433 (+) Transcript_5562:63-1361(+)|eukprot:CAMPEP_0182864464 /NCGR_PEP_ID=MMETSP0034_2-20130328/7180_1 /TAXON_ID=156128 /ORGANISM="Nephroselmis pyriformis, Strain CCMP717" /LENGTH=432 /DNA_ID=CAMNT_0024996719 /DNA_START=49 /DNA_END=1347 /DNA_ORIENTATION=+
MAFRAFNTARKAARTAGYANMSTQAAAVEGKSNNMVKAGVAAVAGLVGYGAYNVAENKGYVPPSEGLVDLIMKVKKTHPDNLAAKHFDMNYYTTLSNEFKRRHLMVLKSGAENADSGMGAYAMQPDDYDLLKPYMDRVIRDYHKIKTEVHHITNWDLSKVKGVPANGKLDLAKLGLPPLSMRVRVGRNLAAFPLPGAMTKEERVNLEKKMAGAFEILMKDPQFGGTYYSLTPGTKYSISDAKYKELVSDHLMFKDMAADEYLASAGIANDWPFGRGCYVSADRGFIVWVGEEDHLRIMCMAKGTVLNDVFDRLRKCLDTVESLPGLTFAHSKDYGYVTSCPTNLGTGMRASVHIALPALTKQGTDEATPKAVAKKFGLSVRGVGGEHTAMGKDGTVDISPSARLCIQEAEIITALYFGIKDLKAAEDKAAGK